MRLQPSPAAPSVTRRRRQGVGRQRATTCVAISILSLLCIQVAASQGLLGWGVRTVLNIVRNTVAKEIFSAIEMRELGEGVVRTLDVISLASDIKHLVEEWGGESGGVAYLGRSAERTTAENLIHMASCPPCRRAFETAVATSGVHIASIELRAPRKVGRNTTYPSATIGLHNTHLEVATHPPLPVSHDRNVNAGVEAEVAYITIYDKSRDDRYADVHVDVQPPGEIATTRATIAEMEVFVAVQFLAKGMFVCLVGVEGQDNVVDPAALTARSQAGQRRTGGDGMVLIPASELMMGTLRGPSRPVRDVQVSAYGIDRFEVTNRVYADFVAETHRLPPRTWRDATFNGADQPVSAVTWADADEYCRWTGRRLPNEAEWELAAQGTTGGNVEQHGRRRPVGTSAGDASRFGVYDMFGNVSEWVSDVDTGYSSKMRGFKVVRGGSVYGGAYPINERRFLAPTVADTTVGFRCASGDGAPVAWRLR